MKQFVILTIVFFSISCGSTKSTEREEISSLEHYVETIDVEYYPYRYPAEDSVFIDLELFKVKEKLYALLDSLIEIKNECPPKYLYNDEFIFSIEKDKKRTYLYISYLSTHDYNYNKSIGYFIYKNYRFNCNDFFCEDFLERTNEIYKFRCVKPEALMIDGIDSGLYWEYVYENGEILNIAYSNCNYHYDEIYNFFYKKEYTY